MKTVRIWHRQQNEPEHAYALFEVYLKLAAPRRMSHAVKSYSENSPVPISLSLASHFQNSYNWKKRALAYDNWKLNREENWLCTKLQREQIVIAKKKLVGREIVIDEALRHLKEISSRSLKTADAAELQKNIQTIRASFELLGLGELDANHQFRTMAQGSGRRIRSVTTTQDPERLLELSHESDAVQRGNPEEEAVLDEADSDLPGSSRPENQDDTGSSG